MKQYVFCMGLIANGMTAIERISSNLKQHQTSWYITYPLASEDEPYGDFETNDIDLLLKRVGVKALLEHVIQKIEKFKMDQTVLEKTLDSMQQELYDMKHAMSQMPVRDSRLFKALQREVKVLKWSMGICFGVGFVYQGYLFYMTEQSLP